MTSGSVTLCENDVNRFVLDSSLHEVVSVGSDSVSLDQSTIHLPTEVRISAARPRIMFVYSFYVCLTHLHVQTSSDYVHVAKNSFDSDSKRTLPSLDNAFSDMKHSPSQVNEFF